MRKTIALKNYNVSDSLKDYIARNENRKLITKSIFITVVAAHKLFDLIPICPVVEWGRLWSVSGFGVYCVVLVEFFLDNGQQHIFPILRSQRILRWRGFSKQ